MIQNSNHRHLVVPQPIATPLHNFAVQGPSPLLPSFSSRPLLPNCLFYTIEPQKSTLYFQAIDFQWEDFRMYSHGLECYGAKRDCGLARGVSRRMGCNSCISTRPPYLVHFHTADRHLLFLFGLFLWVMRWSEVAIGDLSFTSCLYLA